MTNISTSESNIDLFRTQWIWLLLKRLPHHFTIHPCAFLLVFSIEEMFPSNWNCSPSFLADFMADYDCSTFTKPILSSSFFQFKFQTLSKFKDRKKKGHQEKLYLHSNQLQQFKIGIHFLFFLSYASFYLFFKKQQIQKLNYLLFWADCSFQTLQLLM